VKALDAIVDVTGMTITGIQINPIDKLWYLLTGDSQVYRVNSSSASDFHLFCSGKDITEIQIDVDGMLFGIGDDKKIYNATNGAWIKWADNDDSDFKTFTFKLKRKFARKGTSFVEFHQDGTGTKVFPFFFNPGDFR
jgi:hypothetical protein